MSIYLGNTAIGNGNYLGNLNIPDSNIFMSQSVAPTTTTTSTTTIPPFNYVAGAYAIYDFGNPSSYGGTGATVNDVSGNGRNATLVNSPSYSAANGGIMDFTAASSQWMYYTGVIGAECTFISIIKAKNATWSGYGGFPEARRTNGFLWITLQGENNVGYYIWNGGTGPTALYDIWWSVSPINVWNAYGSIVSNSIQKTYLNAGIKTLTNSYSRSNSASGQITLNADNGGTNNFENSYVMGYMHYNSVLTDAQVAQNIAVFSSRF